MKDERNARSPRGQTPERSRLSAVGVNDVRTGASKMTGQPNQAENIMKRVDGTNEIRDEGDPDAVRFQGREQRAFGSIKP